MTRYEFMTRLEKGISGMPDPDKKEALKYYDEYFDDAGPENEERVISELEDPSVIATRLMAEYAYVQTQEPVNKGKSSVKHIWWIVLGICAAPIALPLVISLAAVIFSVLMVVFSVALVFAILAIAFTLSGVAAFIISFIALFSNFAAGLTGMGASLVLLGLGVLIGIVFYLVCRSLLPAFAKSVGQLFKKMTGGRK